LAHLAERRFFNDWPTWNRGKSRRFLGKLGDRKCPWKISQDSEPKNISN